MPEEREVANSRDLRIAAADAKRSVKVLGEIQVLESFLEGESARSLRLSELSDRLEAVEKDEELERWVRLWERANKEHRTMMYDEYEKMCDKLMEVVISLVPTLSKE